MFLVYCTCVLSYIKIFLPSMNSLLVLLINPYSYIVNIKSYLAKIGGSSEHLKPPLVMGLYNSYTYIAIAIVGP